VLAFDVTSEKIKIKPYRGETGMTENLLKAEDIAAVKQVVFGEGVAKRVW
jgi:hypothetical protein